MRFVDLLVTHLFPTSSSRWIFYLEVDSEPEGHRKVTPRREGPLQAKDVQLAVDRVLAQGHEVHVVYEFDRDPLELKDLSELCHAFCEALDQDEDPKTEEVPSFASLPGYVATYVQDEDVDLLTDEIERIFHKNKKGESR